MRPTLTWQSLPPYLRQPVLDGVMTLSQACEICQIDPRARRPVPRHLLDAAARLWLWSQQASTTLH